jgi:hypothetical protein
MSNTAEKLLSVIDRAIGKPTGNRQRLPDPPIPVDIQTIVPRLASVVGYAPARNLVEALLREEKAWQQLYASIIEIGENGLRRAIEDQRQLVLAAQRAGKPLPTVLADSDLEGSRRVKMNILKTEQDSVSRSAAPHAVAILKGLVQQLTPFLERLGDAERELCSRLELPYHESAVTLTLQHVAGVISGRISALQKVEHQHGAPVRFCLGLVQP